MYQSVLAATAADRRRQLRDLARRDGRAAMMRGSLLRRNGRHAA